MKKKIIVYILIGFVLVVVLSVSIYNRNLNQPASKSDEKVAFEIKKGEGVKVVVNNLKDKKLLVHPTSFMVYLKLNGLASYIQAGTYTLEKDMTALELISVITEGRVTTSKITVPEGWKLEEIAEHLDKKGVQKKEAFIEASKKNYDYDFLKDRNNDSLEGYLFPDTYSMPANATSELIIKKMLENFDKKIDPTLRSEISKQGKSIHEILTLASIIEKEVPNDEDRALVAGVFYRRIASDMPLEADSTVNFVTGKSSPSVSAEDLKAESPYNTYRNRGLPPGPICNPSLSAIKAAIFPKESPYLYYLNRQDTKETIFSQNLDEHLENQRKYLE